MAAHELIDADLAIPNGCKLTTQLTWWGTMLGRQPERVDNADPRTRLECGDQIVEQGVGLCDLVILATGRSGFGNAMAGARGPAM